jgi:hypothetical protein
MLHFGGGLQNLAPVVDLIKALPALETLSFCNTDFGNSTGPIVIAIQKHPNITSLRLERGNLWNNLVLWTWLVKNKPSLQKLYISDTCFYGGRLSATALLEQFVESLTGHPNLKEFTFDNVSVKFHNFTSTMDQTVQTAIRRNQADEELGDDAPADNEDDGQTGMAPAPPCGIPVVETDSVVETDDEDEDLEEERETLRVAKERLQARETVCEAEASVSNWSEQHWFNSKLRIGRPW